MKTLKTAKIRSTNLRLACLCLLVMTMICLGGILFAQTGTTEPEQPTGTGIETDPYLIGNLANLRWLSENYEDWYIDDTTPVYIRQTADINAAESSTWNAGAGFRPIGGPFVPDEREPHFLFVGVYDGRGFAVSNLYQSNYPQIAHAGFFSKIEGSTIKNLRLEHVQFNQQDNRGLGGIVGNAQFSTIVNCYTSGTINATNYSVGGIAGFTSLTDTDGCSSSANVTNNGEIADSGGIVGNGFDGTINNSFSTGMVNGGSASSAGGISGSFGGIISNSYSTGNVIGWIAGGISAKINHTTIENCYSTGNITSSDVAGGIVGTFFSNGSISNCYSRGDISTNGTWDSFSGGIVGELSLIYWGNEVLIQNCYATGNLISTDNVTGGIVGYLSGSGPGTVNISNNFWDTTTTNAIHAFGNNFTPPSNYGLPTAQMKQESTFIDAGWDFDFVWDINEDTNDGYPHLRRPEVDNIQPPLNLIAIVDGVNVRLEWDTPETQNIVLGYKAYRDGILLTDRLLEDLFYEDSLTENGTYLYQVTAVYENEESAPATVEAIITSVSDSDENAITLRTTLHSNYPNPFNPETTISFSLSVESHVSIVIFNIRGQKVRTLVNSNHSAGNHSVVWNGKDENGSDVGSGIYFYQMQTNDYVTTRKMVLMK